MRRGGTCPARTRSAPAARRERAPGWRPPLRPCAPSSSPPPPCSRLAARQRVADRLGDALCRRRAVAVGGSAWMEADDADAQHRGALELLGESVARPRPLPVVRRRDVEYVG